MLDGLGIAETTPGPLIMVVQFVGFLGAFRDPGSLNPMVAATFSVILTTWLTFVPCFLWIFLGAPLIENLLGNTALTDARSAVTAAVVWGGAPIWPYGSLCIGSSQKSSFGARSTFPNLPLAMFRIDPDGCSDPGGVPVQCRNPLDPRWLSARGHGMADFCRLAARNNP